MAAFEGLGKALRWLRARQDRRQYEVAETAGVTKAMLSAYETEKQRPSLETLEKILAGLGATLGDLHQALRIVRGKSNPLYTPEPGAHRSSAQAAGSGSAESPATAEVPRTLELDLYRILGAHDPLPVEEEQAMRQMLLGFHGLLRYMHHQAAELTVRSAARAMARNLGGEPTRESVGRESAPEGASAGASTMESLDPLEEVPNG